MENQQHNPWYGTGDVFCALHPWYGTCDVRCCDVLHRHHECVLMSVWEAHDWVFRRLSFAIMRGVSEQLIGRQLADFSW